MGYRLRFILFCTLYSVLCTLSAQAVERTILVGPKTIGKAWKDNIVLESRHFAEAKAGDIITVYHDRAKGTAQGAFQNPTNWQGVAPEYAYFGIKGPFRMTLTDDIVKIAREHGIAIGGHDYRILYVTISDAADYQETIVWKGTPIQMKSDWSVSAEIPAKSFANLREGDAVRFHISKAQAGASIKVMDFTWNVIDRTVDGAPVGGEAFNWYILDNAPLLKIQLAGGGMNTALRVSGTGYRLDKIGIVQFVGEVNEDISQAQRAPKEYLLQPGEIFHGEKAFPNDWSGNLRISAAPFQKCTENDVLLISYKVDPAAKAAGVTPQLSLRNGQTWDEITGAAEPVWYPLDGNDVVYLFDAVALDAVKTRGFILTGVGFTLTRIEILGAN